MSKLERILAVIPTYNECENIRTILERVLKQDDRISVLVVDDNSPDGTGDIVYSIGEKNDRVHLLGRSGKMGLGTAYVAGFKRALAEGYDAIIEIDADLSHNPNDIPRLLRRLDNDDADFAIGSRYVKGVNVVNWPLRRLLLSYFASMYTRVITGMPYNDPTAGFVAIKRKVLESIDLNRVGSNGYAFQIEIKFKSWKKGFRMIEVPIVFTERQEGTSKMNKKIVAEAITMVWRLRFMRIPGAVR